MEDVTPQLFRKAIGRWVTGVAVVLAERDEQIVGMTINSMTSVSLDPLLLLFCAKNTSRAMAEVLDRRKFTINVLTRSQEPVSRHFAGAPGLEGLQYARNDGFIWLEGALVALQCQVETVYPGGDHQIVLSRVMKIVHSEDCLDSPLLFYQGAYASLPGKETSGPVRT